MEYAERRAFGLERMTRLAEAISVRCEVEAVRERLEVLADSGTAGDCEDPAGAFWIEASFKPDGDTSMTVYVKARRGPQASRWDRLAEFAESIAQAEWPRIFAVAQAGTSRTWTS